MSELDPSQVRWVANPADLLGDGAEIDLGEDGEGVLVVQPVLACGGAHLAQGTSQAAGPSAAFEGPEHQNTAAQVSLTIWEGDEKIELITAATRVPLLSGAEVTYGEVVSLAGDFFPAWEDLDTCDPDELRAILGIMADQRLNGYQEKHDKQFNRATGGGSKASDWLPMGRYLKLAQDNYVHFADGNRAYDQWERYHLRACLAAHRLEGQPMTHADNLVALRRALLIEAFADHFLTDLFSSGHMRVPRIKLGDKLGAKRGGMTSKEMHDEDNILGLWVTNKRKDPKRWKALGDKHWNDADNATNGQLCTAAVLRAAREVLTWALKLEALIAKDPVVRNKGVQARLNVLGYACQAIDGDIGPISMAALKRFQQDQKLAESSAADDATVKQLDEIYTSYQGSSKVPDLIPFPEAPTTDAAGNHYPRYFVDGKGNLMQRDGGPHSSKSTSKWGNVFAF